MKRKFEFRLARLEKVRELEEQIARSRWGEAEAIASRCAARVVELEATAIRARSELASLRERGELDVAAASNYERPIETLEAHLQAARGLHRERRQEADREKEAWSEREKARRALERLEERAREEHRLEVATADQVEADEAEARRAARTRAEA